MSYLCWGPDGENLTRQVHDAVHAQPSDVARLNAQDEARPSVGRWRVEVTCSQQHKNVFEGTGNPIDSSHGIIGHPPNAVDDALASAAAGLAPSQSLDRLDAFAKYLLTLGSTFGALLTGLGAFGSASTVYKPLLLIPIGLVSISFGLAVLGLVPRQARLNIANLDEVNTAFNSWVRGRAGIVTLSGLFFAAALFVAPLVIFLTRSDPPSQPSRISLHRSVAKDGTATISGSVDFVGLAAGTVVTTDVTSTASGKSAQILMSDSSMADGQGKLTVKIEASTAAGPPATITATSTPKSGASLTANIQ